MSDSTPTPADATETPATEPASKDTDWVAEARKWEARSKANAAKARENEGAAQRLTELENASKTELQKALDRADAAEKRVKQYETEQQVAAWKTDVAEKAGIPARLLRGTSLEELQAHADEIKTELGATKRGPFVPTPGAIPSTPANENELFARQLFGGTT